MDNKMEALKDEVVYMLIGNDVFGVLQGMDKEELFKDEDEFESLLGYISSKLDIPWTEYVEASIEMYLERKNLK